ncbi:MAG: ABC-2 transporter permease, partial [Paeniclostridium sp.]
MENIINLSKMSFNNLTSIFKNIGIILLIWLVIAIINPSFLSMLFAMGGYLLLYQIMAYEDMYKIDNLISSLPVKKSEYIISRYVLGITISVISIIFLTIFYLI